MVNITGRQKVRFILCNIFSWRILINGRKLDGPDYACALVASIV
jgi:hypothetical protein